PFDEVARFQTRSQRVPRAKDKKPVMQFPLSSLLLSTASIAIAFTTLKNPHPLVAELIRFFVILGACVAVHVALNSTGQKRRSALAFGIFVMGFLGLEACPDSFTAWLHSHLGPAFIVAPSALDSSAMSGNRTLSDYEDAINSRIDLTQTWFAFFCGCAAAIVSWSPVSHSPKMEPN
ncbi:MAG: hypothetical protein AAF989_15485, partial [Planctomycetota bacterium]